MYRHFPMDMLTIGWVSYCTILLLLIIRINIYYSKVGINKTHDPIISFVVWHCYIFHGLRETVFTFVQVCSSNSTGKKRGQECWGGMCKTRYWQSFSNSYPITRPLSLSALWKNPSVQQKQKWYYTAKELACIYACLPLMETLPLLCCLFVKCEEHKKWRILRVKNDEVLDNAGKASRVVCYPCTVVGTYPSRLLSAPKGTTQIWQRGKTFTTQT